HQSKIVVLDIDKEQVVGEITNTPGVHGFALAPRFGRGFSSNGQEDEMSIVDLHGLKTISKAKTGKGPDAVLYEPSRAEVYTFNAGDNSMSRFEADDGDFMGNIALPGKPEFAVADSKAGRIYCNIEDKGEVAVIDLRTHKVISHWPIAPGERPYGM